VRLQAKEWKSSTDIKSQAATLREELLRKKLLWMSLICMVLFIWLKV